MAVCPAGENIISPFLADRKGYLQETVRPLQQRKETVYVVSGSDAEAVVVRRFPNKSVKHVGRSLRPTSIKGFLAVHGGFQNLFRVSRYVFKAFHHRLLRDRALANRG
jgi:hypothetical protein